MIKKHFEVKISNIKLVKFEIPAETEKDAIADALKSISQAPELYLSIDAKELPNNGFCRDCGL